MTETTRTTIDPATGESVAVVGARGKTGRAISSALKDRAVPIIPIGRGEMMNPVEALKGCRAAYLMAPNLHPDERDFISILLGACREAGVDRVVYHSVAAPYAPDMPHHVAKAASEDLVRRSGLQWSILQPCAYIDNLLPGLRGQNPHVAVPYSVDTRFGLISLADLGEIAAAVLLDDFHIGATYELGGPQQLTVRDYAAAAEQVLGRAIEIEASTPQQWVAAHRSAGADSTSGTSLDLREIEWLAAMFSYYDYHGLPCGALPAQAILGRPARSVQEVLRSELS
ncbi:SDR family oxidoreductase [Brevibacterium aurantiacum]|uniref:Nmra family transcriptional regulator n=1 Tax=Brevibacterium aurantiacum TaxID=273384 RepID=A0A556C6Q0_BREAU|nr:NmrA family NAD(P)-binding protein [Brevibacterium aurantiacum]TSI13132.1 nmra family transcriptional regulator [Brevibacterium aurantiacum]